MIDIELATKQELIDEYDYVMNELWGLYSSDCLGFYVDALHREIVRLGGWDPRI